MGIQSQTGLFQNRGDACQSLNSWQFSVHFMEDMISNHDLFSLYRHLQESSPSGYLIFRQTNVGLRTPIPGFLMFPGSCLLPDLEVENVVLQQGSAMSFANTRPHAALRLSCQCQASLKHRAPDSESRPK